MNQIKETFSVQIQMQRAHVLDLDYTAIGEHKSSEILAEKLNKCEILLGAFLFADCPGPIRAIIDRIRDIDRSIVVFGEEHQRESRLCFHY